MRNLHGVHCCLGRVLATFFAGVFATLAFVGCSHSPEAPVTKTSTGPSWDTKFNEGKKLLASREFEKSLQAFDDLTKRAPNAPRYFDLLLAKGEALAGLARWSDAAEIYLQASRLASQKEDFVGEAEALYQLALCTEALGDDLREVSILRDLLKKKPYLSDERGSVEVPARLAAAYARMGVEQPAERFFKEAERELARLERLRVTSKLPPEWLVKLLYNMGALSLRPLTSENYEASLRPLPRAQVYLLRAASLQHPTWSEKSSEELIKTFQRAWELVQQVPLPQEPDVVLAKKLQYEKKREMGEPLLEVLDQSADFRTASDEPLSPQVQKVFQVVKEIRSQLEALLLTIPPHRQRTPEAESREGLRREGKLVDPEPKPTKKLPLKKKATEEAP